MAINKISIEDLREMIQRVSVTGATFQALVHDAAVQSLIVVRDEGDYGPARDLMNAVPKGVRREGLGIWFNRFSNGKLKVLRNNETGLYDCKLSKDRAVTDFDVEGAAKINFADLTKEPKANTFTLEKLIKQLQSKANNTDLNDDGTPKVDEPARAMAAKLLAAIYSGSLSQKNEASAS